LQAHVTHALDQVPQVHGTPCFLNVRGEPSPALRGVVLGYSGFIEVHAHTVARIALPTPHVKLSFSFGSVLRVVSSKQVASYRSFVARPSAEPVQLEHGGFRHRVNAVLTPLGACRVLGLRLGELPEYVSIEDALGPFAHEATEQLAGAATWRERFQILDRLLEQRLARPSKLDGDVGARALLRLEQTDGTLAIRDLARELGCTRKHVHERVAAVGGVCPKLYASLLRFHRVVHAMRATTPTTVAEIARDSGYYDPSHLHRDVRRFSGTSPRELWRDLAGTVPGRFVEPI